MASRIARVTGTKRGRGFAVCRQLAEAGMQVYLSSRELSEGEQAAHELQQQGLRVTAVQLDVSRPESVTHCFTSLQQQNVDIDVLVNTAGVYPTTPSIQVSEQ